ncbi:hypothetical protein [Peterkaempfera bronchialis]|uniref:hypothetical protein n=1 Tax=Peterkaempfera bronchialis TaxID=2126346 RepID=UPI0013B3C579|nr:hypothetical protein [Peterkaempfera bronchialis]
MTEELTKDHEAAERDPREHGYCVLESVIPAAQQTEPRYRIVELTEQEGRDGTAFVTVRPGLGQIDAYPSPAPPGPRLTIDMW